MPLAFRIAFDFDPNFAPAREYFGLSYSRTRFRNDHVAPERGPSESGVSPIGTLFGSTYQILVNFVPQHRTITVSSNSFRFRSAFV